MALTLQQLKDAMGDIVLLVAFDNATRKYVKFTIDDLPPATITLIVNWINARIG